MSPLFTMWPRRAHDLFRRGDFTADDAWVLITLVTNADRETHEAVFPSVSALRAELGWDRNRTATAQHVRNRLERLRTLGEISFKLQQGQRAPLVVRVEKSDYFQNDPPRVLEVISRRWKSDAPDGSDTRSEATFELPTLEVADEQTRPDPERDLKPEQPGAVLEEKSRDGEDPSRTRARELVAQLRTGVEDSTLSTVTRYVRQLPAHIVDDVEAGLRAAIADESVRKSDAAYLVGALKRRGLGSQR